MKRFRDSSGRLAIPVLEVFRKTAAEAAEYYRPGRKYLHRGRVYTLLEISPYCHFRSDDGYENFGPTVDCMGVFLPDVASEGSEIVLIGGDGE